MATIPFDTYKFVQTLRQAGFDEKQAEAVSLAFREAQGEAELATKTDLREMELRLTTKLGAMTAACVAAVAALIKIL